MPHPVTIMNRLTLLLLAFPLVIAEGASITNPFYSDPSWKLWDVDQTPTDDLTYPSESDRLFPADVPGSETNPGIFLNILSEDYAGRTYAGWTSDVNASFDNYHSRLKQVWADRHGNHVDFRADGGWSLMDYTTGTYENGNPKYNYYYDNKLNGVNWTHQSTTYMGPFNVNSQGSARQIEEEYYFIGALRAGPGTGGVYDEYFALSPTLYNSIGASSSEVYALTKMIIAGGFLPRDLKPEMKRQGLYASNALYNWKAGLPFDVPFANELRHQVRYYSTGFSQFLPVPLPDYFEFVGNPEDSYDPSLHLRNMVERAKATTVIAPEAIVIPEGSITGGSLATATKKFLRYDQNDGERITFRVSMTESYDIQGFPLSYDATVLWGNRETEITDLGGGSFEITAPFIDALPNGFTPILFTASNGVTVGNPSIVNIHHPYVVDGNGRNDDRNTRPLKAEGMGDIKALPGETVVFDLDSRDADGFPLTWYKWQGVGEMDGNYFVWDIPEDQPIGVYDAVTVGSDGSNGDAYTGDKARITVRDVVAGATATPSVGIVPLTVGFDASASRAGDGSGMTYTWDFGDGGTATGIAPSHTFTQHGVYAVELTVTPTGGTPGGDIHTLFIEVRPDSTPVLNNGWSTVDGDGVLDTAVWSDFDTEDNAPVVKTNSDRYRQHLQPNGGVETVADFAAPFYIETDFFWGDLSNLNALEILGIKFGFLERGSPFGFSAHTAEDLLGGSADLTPITQPDGEIDSGARLRLSIQEDTAHPGNFRATGVIETTSGTTGFSFDNLTPADTKIRLHRNFHPWNLQVWDAVQSPVAGPEIEFVDADAESLFDRGPRDAAGVTSRLRTKANFGSVAVGQFIDRTYTVRNLGTEPLTLSGTTPFFSNHWTGSDNDDFEIITAPASIIPPGGSSDFTMRFTATHTGHHRSVKSLETNDPDEPEIRLELIGYGKAPAELLVRGRNLNLAAGDATPNRFDNTDFAAVNTGSSQTREFMLHNLGDDPIAISTVMLSGSSDFTIEKQPRAILDSQESSLLVLRLTPTSIGAKSAMLTINSDCPQNPAYSFSITGEGETPGTPTLQLAGNNQNIADGDTTPSGSDGTDFGLTGLGTGGELVQSFHITNNGTAPLELGLDAIQFSGANADLFFLRQRPASTVPAGTSTVFKVAFRASNPTVANATITVSPTDATPSQSFSIRAEADGNIATYSLETSVGYQPTNGESTPLVSNGTATQVNAGSEGILSFNITNTSATVTIDTINLSITGADASLFSIATPPGASLAPGASTTFEIAVTPAAAQTYGATLSLDLAPTVDSPFQFDLQAHGLEDSVSFVKDWYGADEDAFAEEVTIEVERIGNGVGPASVEVGLNTSNSNADPATDFSFSAQTLSWADGETGVRTVAIDYFADTESEIDEFFELTLTALANARQGTYQDTNVYVYNDDYQPVNAQEFSKNSDPFDLNGKQLIWRPDGEGDYQGAIIDIAAFPTDVTLGTVISDGSSTILASGETFRIDLPAGLQLPFYGDLYSTIYIGADGYVTLGIDEPYRYGSAYSMYNINTSHLAPRVALYWDSLQPSSGGEIRYFVDETPEQQRLVVTFLDVPDEFKPAMLVNAQLEIWVNGTITMTYLDHLTGPDYYYGVVGIADGNPVIGYQDIDLSALPPPGLTLLAASPTLGNVQQAYSDTLEAVGGAIPYSWQLLAGSLPAGLSLNATTGEISGTPTSAGSFTFTVEVADSESDTDSAEISLNVISATSDIDSNGLLDQWEIDNFGALGQDPNGDPDTDGADNFAEENAGSDPNLADSDSDGVDDGDELGLGRDPVGVDRIVLDFLDDFERGPGPLAGYPGMWSLDTSGSTGEIKAALGASSSNGLELVTGSGETAGLTLHLPAVWQPADWKQFDAILATFADDADAPSVHPDSKVAFYLTESGDIRARDGASWVLLDLEPGLDTETMHTYTVRQDHVTSLWKLWVNGTLATDPSLAFANETTAPGFVLITQAEGQTAVFDNFAVSSGPPEGISLSGLNDYVSWRDGGGITWNGADSSSTADPNANGLTNLLEYGFGFTDPAAGTHSYTTPVILNAGGETVSFSFRRNREAEDLTFTVQTSPDLSPGSWTDLAPGEASITDLGNGVDEITVNVPAAEENVFVRLKVGQQ